MNNSHETLNNIALFSLIDNQQCTSMYLAKGTIEAAFINLDPLWQALAYLMWLIGIVERDCEVYLD